MNKRLAMQRMSMYNAVTAAHPEYFGDPLTYYATHPLDGREMPVGSAFSGPAYGDKHKSIGKIVTAAVAVVALVATGGTAAGFFGSLASTLTTVGSISTLLGTVTGNKTLMTVGGLMMAGGGLLNAAGTKGTWLNEHFGEFASKAESGFQSVFKSNANAISSGAELSSVGSVNPGSGAGVVDGAGSGNLNLTADAPALPTADGGGGLLNSGGDTAALAGDQVGALNGSIPGEAATVSDINGTIPGEVASSAGDSIGMSKIGGTTGVSADVTEGAMSVVGKDGSVSSVINRDSMAALGDKLKASSAASSAADGPSNLFKDVSAFTKDNKELLQIAMQFGQGLFTDNSARDDYYKASTNLYNMKTSEMAQQAANAQYQGDISKNFWVNPQANVHGNPRVFTQPTTPGGLIQQRAVTQRA